MRKNHIVGVVGSAAVALSLTLTLGACGGSGNQSTSTATEEAAVAETTASTETAETTSDAEAEQTYTATVKDENGDPVADAGVAFCSVDRCNIVYTDANGVATYVGDLPELEVHVALPPEGFAENDQSLTEGDDMVFTLQRQ